MAGITILDVPFPPRLALDAQRTPRWRTGLTETTSGFLKSDRKWSKAMHSFDVSFAVRTASAYDLIVQHFHEVRGRGYGFPFRDPLDHRVDASRSSMPESGGGYQLSKTYGSVNPYVRAITRPKSGTVTIFRTRAGNTVDITSSCTISYTTGLVHMSTGVIIPGDTLAWAGEFFVPCMYGSDELPGLIVDRRPNGGELLVQCPSIVIDEVRQ